MKKFLFTGFVVLFTLFGVFGQSKEKLVSGPWAGNVEFRTAMIWLEVSPSVKNVSIQYYPDSQPSFVKTIHYQGALGKSFNPIKVALTNLELATRYHYEVILDKKKINVPFPTTFQTKDLWPYRKPAPDFSFLAGSCAYFNEPKYDRPGKPYGGDSTIFETMAKTPASFHVWLGDNWYTREVDYSSAWGLHYRASHDRSHKVLQAFMASMPQYAIWDDHDFGPNDAGKSYIYKNESRAIFNNYWLNPSCGEDEKGIYTKVSYSDVDLFLTDDRFFRSEDEIPDSIQGQPNSSKEFFGTTQMEWLKNSLLFSKATFKIIVVGSQVLNTFNQYECMQRYPYEYNMLLNFLSDQKIKGVLFLTGDRHHSEIIKMNRNNLYPLFDITCSPYTSGISRVAKSIEENNPLREPNSLVEAQNFAKFSFTGKKGERNMKVEFIGIKGDKLGEWSIDERALK